MARVTSITLSVNPTVVVGGDYLKASASMTVSIEEGEDPVKVATESQPVLKDLYVRALESELYAITLSRKRDRTSTLVKYLQAKIRRSEDARKA